MIEDARIEQELTAWLRDRGSWGSDVRVAGLRRPSVGYASNTYLVDLVERSADGPERIVLRLPPDRDTHLGETLRRQVRVQNALAGGGLPVPAPATYESDDRWLGRPFLVMPCIEGHVGGEVPAIDPWISASTPAQQAALYGEFTDRMADLHRFDWRAEPGLDEVVRGRDDRAVDHLDYWRRYLEWATEGAAPAPLVAALDRCRATAPDDSSDHDPPTSLLWGDARLGNAIFDDDRHLVALIDWETACVGPAELDLGYWLGLEAVLDEVMGSRPPGFPERAETIARYAERLGRPLVDLDWYETLGLLSAGCISARLTVLAKGRAPTEAELAAHPVLARVEQLQADA